MFLAGGGSRLKGLRRKIAQYLEMDENRVAVAGSFYQLHCISEEELGLPEYATPLGILISAGLGLTHDNYRIFLNGTPARLFGNGTLTVRDVLLMNGFSYRDMVGSAGRNLVITVNGTRKVFPGAKARAAVLLVNEKEAALSERVYPGDSIRFEEAHSGEAASVSAAQVLGIAGEEWVMINGERQRASTLLQPGDQLEFTPDTLEREKQESALRVGKMETEDHSKILSPMHVKLNHEKILLEPKPDGRPYYLMDMLDKTGLNFRELKYPAVLLVNGQDASFRRILKEGDQIEIRADEPEK